MVFKAIYAQLMGGPSAMGICALFYIYIDLPLDVPCAVYAVLKASLVDWGGQSTMGIYALFYIYRSAKFGVVVFMASLLECGGQSVTHPCYTVTPFPYQLTIDPLLHHYTP